MTNYSYRINELEEFRRNRDRGYYDAGYYYECPEEWEAVARAAQNMTGQAIIVYRHVNNGLAEPDKVLAVLCKGRQVWPIISLGSASNV